MRWFGVAGAAAAWVACLPAPPGPPPVEGAKAPPADGGDPTGRGGASELARPAAPSATVPPTLELPECSRCVDAKEHPAIQASIDAAKPRTWECYERALLGDPTLGDVSVNVSVRAMAKGGRPCSVTSVGVRAVSNCVSDVLWQMEIGPVGRTCVEVRHISVAFKRSDSSLKPSAKPSE